MLDSSVLLTFTHILRASNEYLHLRTFRDTCIAPIIHDLRWSRQGQSVLPEAGSIFSTQVSDIVEACHF